ncbi:MAG: four helix bundle protein [Flavobacteriales bacterium]|nr:four helix bundle protein [Flavobacteriales bacterium]MBQ21719.1 four helix bundle protein [Flavobacteriales bacterium]MCW8898416.1 four helix bundle protein [Flavobacteriales bacterium]MCW8913310.1 four helix bundle protein [Flavobacteriales bacterium]MCW8938342.1 four helix bundle protein [Flavobacteriales bacterium]|tara:strand:+ start:6898 stop:7245 length:348 start_codon:yes stop_codon:yes gene_type:complete
MKKSIIQEKSFDFSLIIIKLYQKMIDQKEYVLSKQLLRSGTSIGANIEEATAGISKKDFISKMSISSKEARETRYWLKLIDKSDLVEIDVNEELKLVEDLINILTSIVKTAQKNI